MSNPTQMRDAGRKAVRQTAEKLRPPLYEEPRQSVLNKLANEHLNQTLECRARTAVSRNRTHLRFPAMLIVTALLSGCLPRDSREAGPARHDLQNTQAQPVDSEVIADAARIQFLGMTMMNPTDELIERYGLSASMLPGPVITELTEKASSYWQDTPHEGCSFWIIENPAHGFLFNEERSPRYKPLTVRQLLEAIIACTVSPEVYQKLMDDTRERCRRQAGTLEDHPEKRARLLRIAELEMPEEDRGMYICRAVYRYPKKRGTMTTHLRMTEHDFNQLCELALK